jgi:protein TonB
MNRLRFVVDAEGKVVSYSMAGGSGNAALDRATLEMIRRAGKVPKPPAELLNNGTIERGARWTAAETFVSVTNRQV